MATLKAYHWIADTPGIEPDRPWVRQCDAIVAARSKAEVARLVEIGHDSGWRPVQVKDLFNLSETGNLTEQILTLGAPGIIFYAPEFTRVYQPVGGQPLPLLPMAPQVLLQAWRDRYPQEQRSHREDMYQQAQNALPQIRQAWQAVRDRWPEAQTAS